MGGNKEVKEKNKLITSAVYVVVVYLSVCLSVCHTLVLYTEMAKHRITETTPYAI